MACHYYSFIVLFYPKELHGAFDIHKYGTKILHSFVTTRKKKAAAEADSSNGVNETADEDVSVTEMEKAMGKIVPFREIASGRPAHDVSRLFLATLQLVRKGLFFRYSALCHIILNDEKCLL